MSINVFSIRKAILADMQRAKLKHAPLTLDELVVISCEAAITYASRAELETEWGNLYLRGYLEVFPGFGGAYRRITEKGSAQLMIDVEQDVFIHGTSAV